MHHDDDSSADRRRVDREAAALLHGHRERLQPPPGAADASWTALRARIRAGEPSPLADEAPPSRRARWPAVVIVAGAAVAAAVLLRLGPAALGRGEAQRGHEAALQRLDPDARQRAAAGRGAAVREDMPLQTADADGPSPGDSAAADSHVPEDSQLARELAQVRAAGEAARAGRGREALVAAETYLRDHPNGTFAPEARLHRAEALCLLGRTSDADAAKAAFVRELPDSPLRARMSAVCAEPSPQK